MTSGSIRSTLPLASSIETAVFAVQHGFHFALGHAMLSLAPQQPPANLRTD
jgi:hypothetical protein